MCEYKECVCVFVCVSECVRVRECFNLHIVVLRANVCMCVHTCVCVCECVCLSVYKSVLNSILVIVLVHCNVSDSIWFLRMH